MKNKRITWPGFDPDTFSIQTLHATPVPWRHNHDYGKNFWFINKYKNEFIWGTLLLLDIPKVPSDSTIQELCKSVFRMFGIQKLTRLDSDHMRRDTFNKINDWSLKEQN